MEFKGTKGVWNACCLNAKPHFIFTEASERTICRIYQEQDDGCSLPIEQVRANALLISKSPEMLEMLKHLISLKHAKDLDGKTPYYLEEMPKAWVKAEHLIKRATDITIENKE